MEIKLNAPQTLVLPSPEKWLGQSVEWSLETLNFSRFDVDLHLDARLFNLQITYRSGMYLVILVVTGRLPQHVECFVQLAISGDGAEPQPLDRLKLWWCRTTAPDLLNWDAVAALLRKALPQLLQQMVDNPVGEVSPVAGIQARLDGATAAEVDDEEES